MKDRNKGTIIVTGGCGYIGSHTIVEILEKTSYDVISIDNFSNSSPDAITRIEHITGVRIINFDIDLCDKDASIQVFSKIEFIVGVIHFAALKSVPDSVANPIHYYHNNNQSLLNVLSACKSRNIKSLIFSSSCSVYGNVTKLPVDEDTLLNKAQSPYGATKQIGEEIIEHFTNVNKINCIALRYFNPVGAHMSGKLGEFQINKPNNLIPVITQTAAGLNKQMIVFGKNLKTRDGSCLRDYVHVTDIANAHISAMRYLTTSKNNKPFEIFNLGTGKGITVLEAIKAFEKNTGEKLNYKIGDRREGDVEAIYSNSQKAKEKLNWQAEFTIDDMMTSAWKWQQSILENI